ncbi:MAG: hypothetical protein Q4C86_10890 [bacterium]|nr:hypothetical protein [bacterium]
MAEVSIVGICNMALRLVNVQTIDSLDEASDPARKCKDFYDMALDFLLREAVWHFARSFFQLSRLAFVHPHWRHVYGLPDDFLYAVRVFPCELDGEENYRQERYSSADARFEIARLGGATDRSSVCLTDVPRAMLEYVARVTDPTVFDAHFVELLTLKLAALLAPPLTGAAQLAQYYESRLAQALQHAKALNAGEGRRREVKRPRESSFILARRGLRRG